jgi:hypothetical protein
MSGPAKETQRARQRRRLAEALRQNLKRRRAQAKERAAAEGAQERTTSHDSAGFPADKQGG